MHVDRAFIHALLLAGQRANVPSDDQRARALIAILASRRESLLAVTLNLDYAHPATPGPLNMRL